MRNRVVTAGDLRMAGAEPGVIARATGNGTLQRIEGITGIYVVGAEPYDDTTHMQVAATVAGPGAVISGTWAARLLGQPWIPDGGSCLVKVAGERRRRGAEGLVTVSRCDSLERIDTWTYQGLQVACAPHATIDAARQIQVEPAHRWADVDRQLRDVRGVVLGAVAQRHCTRAELDQALSLGSTRHTALVRRALLDASRGAASPPEAEAVDGLLACGIPFFCNVAIYLDGVLLGIADLFLIGTGVGGELDSKQEHGEDDRLDSTLVRDDGFREGELDLRHITPTRYRADPDAFHNKLINAARRRLAAGYVDPPGLRLVPRGPLLYQPCASPPYQLPPGVLERHLALGRAETA